jgi:hypothetical protein
MDDRSLCAHGRWRNQGYLVRSAVEIICRREERPSSGSRRFRRRVCGNHHNHGSGVETSRTSNVRSTPATMAYRAELRRKLPVHRNRLAKSSSPVAFHQCREAAVDLDQFRSSITVSLVPFSTAWVATTRLAAVPVFVYAAVLVLVELAYLQFEGHVLAQVGVEELSHRARQFAKIRSFVALGIFASAMLLSLKFPFWGFGLVSCAVLLYLRPEPPGTGEYA